MYVSTSVPENYIGKLKIGTTVDAEIGSIGKIYVGKIRQIGNNINETNRSFGIEVSVPNPENLLRPNQVAKLKIVDYSNKSAILVPSNIIQQDAQGNQFVFVANNASKNSAVAKKTMVETGQTANNATEILSGLNAGDIIVAEGANTISEGMKLTF
jgi:RND family efflux transporter MFP subunit